MYCEYCDKTIKYEAVVIDFERIDMERIFFCDDMCKDDYMKNHTYGVTFTDDDEEYDEYDGQDDEVKDEVYI